MTSRIQQICDVNCAAWSIHQKPSSVLCLCEAEAVQLKHIKSNDGLSYFFPQFLIEYKYIFFMR